MTEKSSICKCGCWEGNHDKNGCFYLRTKEKFNEHKCRRFIPRKQEKKKGGKKHGNNNA